MHSTENETTQEFTRQTLYNWENAIQKIYEEQEFFDVASLPDFNNLYHEATRQASVAHHNTVSFMALQDDLAFCSREAVYFTAHLFAYKPYINNLLEHPIWFGNKWVYRNITNDNLFNRYIMFADIVLQSFYNYWDRVGDILAYYFKDSVQIDVDKPIFFPAVIDRLARYHQNNPHYIWLKKFKDNEYTMLNEQRKKTVHSETFSTRLKNQHLDDPTDRPKIEALQAEREGLPDYFKKHIKLSLEGFRETMLFLKDLNPALYGHIE